MIETLDDIVEQLADALAVYGSHSVEQPDEQCACRSCWTTELKMRIRRAVEVEAALNVNNRLAAIERALKEGKE